MKSKVRADKNKSHRSQSIDELLERIEIDLNRLEVSLTAYAHSSHPYRWEAVRWHIPTLEARLEALRRLRRHRPLKLTDSGSRIQD